jgi:hypothetical protein
MAKIPTFEATIAPTAEVGAVKSNIQVSPKSSLAGALLPAANAITQFYVKEKEISNKVEGGQLIADANQELLEIKEQAKLKSTPDEGVNFFNAGYKQVVDKYKSKASNNYIQRYFDLNISSNKPSYINNVLKQTRANLVKTRVNQVTNNVENKILNAVESGNDFDLATVRESVTAEYQGLVSDGLISEQDLQIYRDKIPNLIEVAQVRKIARNNASQAFLILSDINNFKTIQGDERRKLISEFGTLAKQQADVTSAVLNQSIIEKSKQFMEKYGDKEKFGFTPEELEEFKTGDEETDNQIVILNEKMVNKEFSFDTNYNINTDVISKIVSGEIQNTSTKFLLSGETEPKSILERAGNKTINDNDFKFLSDVITRNKNNTFKKQDQQFLKYFENLVPLLQGNTFLNYFDKEYNAKASELRQTLHSRYLNGLAQGANPTDLLSYTSENYIAKDIKNFLPKTSDLSSIVIEMAAENNQTVDGPPRIEGETAEEYLNRIQKEEKKIDVGDEDSPDLSASLDINVEPKFANFEQNNNIKSINNYLIKRISPEASAAILGNMFAEGEKFNFNQEENTTRKRKGYGLFQFTDVADGEGHRTEYFKYLKNTNKKDSAESQIDYVLDNIYEGIGYDIGAGNRIKLQNIFKNEKSILKITKAFHDIFERPQPGSLGKRQNAAEKIYQLLTNTFPI